MKTSGLMFKAEMILAYIQGMKNQTRRTRGLDFINQNPDNWKLDSIYGESFIFKGKGSMFTAKAPYGVFGDTLWFKETWKMFERESDGQDFLHYRADDAKVNPTWWSENEWTRPDPVWAGRFEKWQSSMFMPHICARFRDIPIIDVRVERLLNITTESALLEGIRIPYERGIVGQGPADQAYLEYWDVINGKTMSASKNPWVWVYEFPTKAQP